MKRTFAAERAVRVALPGLFLYSVHYAARANRGGGGYHSYPGCGHRQRHARAMDAHGNRPKIMGAPGVSESAVGIPKEGAPVMYGLYDAAEGYLVQPDGSFYMDGSFANYMSIK